MRVNAMTAILKLGWHSDAALELVIASLNDPVAMSGALVWKSSSALGTPERSPLPSTS